MSPRARNAAIAAAVFVLAAWRPAPVARVDRWVVARIGGEGPREALRWLTRLGDPTVVVVLAIVAGLFLVRRRGGVFVLVAGVLAAGLLADLGKDLVERARPAGSYERNFGFPSAHAARTGALAALLRRPEAVALAVLVGLTRVLLGVHWPSDVVGGWALGALVAEAAPRVRGSRP